MIVQPNKIKTNSSFLEKRQLKGYKISIKNFRKNILLKSRPSRNSRPESSVNLSPQKFKINSQEITPRSNYLSAIKNIGPIPQQEKIQGGMSINNISKIIKTQQNDRMSEYVLLLLKKKDEESCKEMWEALKCEDQKKKKEKLGLKMNPYCRKMKAHSIKVKNLREKSHQQTISYAPHPLRHSLESGGYNEILSKIRKSEQLRKRAKQSSLGSVSKNKISSLSQRQQ